MYPAGRVIHRRELDIRSEIDASKPLKKFRRATLRDARAAVDDDVPVETDFIAGTCFDRESDPRVSADVADLAVLRQVRCDQFLAIKSDPHDRDLGSTVRFERDEVRKRRTFEHRTSRVRNRRHAANLAPLPRAIALPHARVNQSNSIVAQQLLCRQDGHPANGGACSAKRRGEAPPPRKHPHLLCRRTGCRPSTAAPGARPSKAELSEGLIASSCRWDSPAPSTSRRMVILHAPTGCPVRPVQSCRACGNSRPKESIDE